MNLVDKMVNLDIFDKYLTVKGGSISLKSNIAKITMRQFIFKLIKTFKKDFNKKKRGGVADIYNDSSISYSTNISDLTFAKFKFDDYTSPVRDIY
jgi:hypothetical protein